MKRPIFILLAIGALASAPAASAVQGSGSPGDRSAQISQLESRDAQLGEKLARTPVPQGKGETFRAIERQQIRAQRQRIQDMIEKLRSGQQVDPAEIDRAR